VVVKDICWPAGISMPSGTWWRCMRGR
jgi:hypothetical protein